MYSDDFKNIPNGTEINVSKSFRATLISSVKNIKIVNRDRQHVVLVVYIMFAKSMNADNNIMEKPRLEKA